MSGLRSAGTQNYIPLALLTRAWCSFAEARRLIEKYGYWRRKEELEDAEAAIL